MNERFAWNNRKIVRRETKSKGVAYKLGAGSKKSYGSQHSEISLFEVAPVDKERSNHVTNNRLTFR